MVHLRSETFALPNPLYHYDKEMGNEQSDIRFYTSLGEKALMEGHGVKDGANHESRADSAYFTISFGDQDMENTGAYGELNSMFFNNLNLEITSAHDYDRVTF